MRLQIMLFLFIPKSGVKKLSALCQQQLNTYEEVKPLKIF
jgi:hypothetical protein